MGKLHKIRDPVHNFVELRDREVKLMDTPVYQRLRGIRQLAMANLVYPGALHTRFDHSLGVCHVAGLMAEELDLGEDEITLVRLAALLHDLGHGPFSHVSEISLSRFADPAKLKVGQKKEKIHELVTTSIIQSDLDIQKILAPYDRENITKLLAEGYSHPAMKSIVSGPLDADKQDYLLRDSRYAGVTYGVYDIHQLHRAVKLGGDSDEQELWIKADGVPAVEQFVMAKYYMTTNVYRHRVRLITDQMISRAISLGIESDNIPELNQLYRFDNTDGFIRNYLTWDDARFLREFTSSRWETTKCGRIVRRLVERRLFKLVFRDLFTKFTDSTRERLFKLTSNDPKLPEAEQRQNRADWSAMEIAIAGAINDVVPEEVKAEHVIANPLNVKLDPTIAKNDEAHIVVDRAGEPRPFVDESALFVALSKGFSEKYLEVYASVEWSNPTEKRQKRRALDKAIREAIEAFASPPAGEKP